MAGNNIREEDGAGTSSDATGTLRLQPGDSVMEWRSSDQAENGTPSTSPPYWEIDDDDDSGPRPADLYGKFTWKIENFSKISKRELRSNVFEVGGYKWYILVYPQGCDVCNHLSLFLCVADYDKLLPGWSHFAQFTIAVVNKDPKKSKYSDTLHRFCKKEHDWGWKKFMELSKVLDGFTMADTLIIKAQVQVIRENPHRPFRCLDCQYRRELVRVYLTNVEGICRRFVEEKQEKLGNLIGDSVRWSSFRAFWLAVEENVRHRMAREKTDVVLKTVVKRFFNEKEVTSTLVMDALYSGCKALDYQSRQRKGKIQGVELEDTPSPVVWVEKDTFVLADDVLPLLERVTTEPLPPFKDDKGPQTRTKDGTSGDDFGKDSIERDERHLIELGRRTIEMFVLAHLFSNRVEVAYREAIALKRQEELIREEEAAGLAEIELRAKREAAEKEKRSKKKQAKQRRNIRKGKDRGRDEKCDMQVQVKNQHESPSGLRKLKECSLKERSASDLAISRTADEDDLSGLENTDNVVGTLGPETEDGDINRVDWDRDVSETQQAMEASSSGAVSQPAQCDQIGRQHQAALDDSSSTCSTDSLPSVAMNGSYRGSSLLLSQYQPLPVRGKNRTDIERYDKNGCILESDNLRGGTGVDLSSTPEPSSSCSRARLDAETIILCLKERVSWLEQQLVEKEEEVVSLRKQLSLQQHQMDLERLDKHFQDKTPKHSYIRDSGLSSYLNVDDVKCKSSCMQADNLPNDCSNSISLEELQSRHSLSKNLLVQSSNLAKNNLTMDMSNKQIPYPLLKQDSLKSTPMSITTELSHPLQCTNSSSSLALERDKTCNLEDSLSSNIDQSLPFCSSSTTEFRDISRPSSAPLIPVGPRPYTHVVSSQPVPSLARSVSAAGRLGAGVDSTASGDSSVSQSPPVTPSYRNAAAGKMRSTSNSGHVPHPVSSAGQAAGRCMQNPSPSSIFSSCTSSSSPMPSLSKAHMSCAQPFGLMRGDASPSSVSISSCISMPQASVLNAYGQEQIDHSGTRMGFTFGTVTPESLHKQHPWELVLDANGMISQVEERVCKQEPHQQQQIFLEQCMQQQQGELQNRKMHQVQSEHANLDIRFQQASSDKLAIQGSLKNIDSARGIRQASTVLAEEFPHLDIINYLLDEEQNLDKAALSAMLEHPGGQHSNIQLYFPGLHCISSGQLCPETRLLNTGRFDRSVVQEDGVLQVHCSPDRPSIGPRESTQMLSPYAHSPHAESYDQHSGIPEGVPPNFWPVCSDDLSENSIMNNGHAALNAPIMGYSIQGNHMLVADCSNFTLGLNGYTVFSSTNQP